MSATALLCAPFAKTFPVFAVIVAFYGFGLGSWLLLIPVLLSDNHGTDAIASSYGLIRLFQGIVALMVPPLVGNLHLDKFKCDFRFKTFFFNRPFQGFKWRLYNRILLHGSINDFGVCINSF